MYCDFVKGGEAGYRAAIHEAVPSIKVLDDVSFDEEGGAAGKDEGETGSRSCVFAASEAGVRKDWHILQQSIKQGLQVEQGQ